MAEIFDFLARHKIMVKIGISVLILALLVQKMDFSSLQEHMHEFNASIWISATLLVILQLILVSFRWGILINLRRHKIGLMESVRITVLSGIANLIFITSIGGMVVRIALAVQNGAGFMRSIIATFFDRFLTLIALLTLTAVFFPYLKTYLPQEIFVSLNLFMMAIPICALLAIPLFFKKTYNNRLFLNRKLATTAKYIRDLMTSRKALLITLLMSLVAQMSYIYSIYLFVEDANVTISILALFAILPVIALVASLPIGFGGWGIREGAFIYGLGLIGIPTEDAFLISVQVGLVGILATILASLPIILTDSKSISYLKPKKLLP